MRPGTSETKQTRNRTSGDPGRCIINRDRCGHALRNDAGKDAEPGIGNERPAARTITKDADSFPLRHTQTHTHTHTTADTPRIAKDVKRNQKEKGGFASRFYHEILFSGLIRSQRNPTQPNIAQPNLT